MFTVEYYPPGREDSLIFFCDEKPTFVLVDEASGSMHTLMCSFVPTNGSSRGQRVLTPAAHCLVGGSGDGLMAVTYGEIHRRVQPDLDYSENAVAVSAFTTVEIPYGADYIGVQVESPGLWGIEIAGDETDEPYLAQVFAEERDTLLAMLAALGAKAREEKVLTPWGTTADS